MLNNNQNFLFVKKNTNININPRLRYHTPAPASIGNNSQFRKLVNINLNNTSNSPKNDNNIISYYPNQNYNPYQREFNFLKLKFKDYEMATNEIKYLTQELNKLNETLKNKNAIIYEFQQLAQVSKNKFESLINNDKKKTMTEEFGNIFENIDKLQKENINLSNKLMLLENENKSLTRQFKNIENNRKDFLKTDNNENRPKKVMKFQGLKNKNDENLEIDLNEIKSKYYFLEKQIKEKDENINKLSIINKKLNEQLKLNKNSKIKSGTKRCDIDIKKENSYSNYDNDYHYNLHSNDVSIISQGGRTNLTVGNLRPNSEKRAGLRSYDYKIDSEDAIKYSNYLLNNLKNDISKMKFEN